MTSGSVSYTHLDVYKRQEFTLLEDTAQRMLQYPTVPCNDCKYCMPCPYGLEDVYKRQTLFYANSQHPDQAVTTLAIAARNEHNEFLESPIPPCGACRQVRCV